MEEVDKGRGRKRGKLRVGMTETKRMEEGDRRGWRRLTDDGDEYWYKGIDKFSFLSLLYREEDILYGLIIQVTLSQ